MATETEKEASNHPGHELEAASEWGMEKHEADKSGSLGADKSAAEDVENRLRRDLESQMVKREQEFSGCEVQSAPC